MQSTVRRPAVRNMRRALYVQYTAGLMVYYGVSIVGYWAYGSEVSDYLPKDLSRPKWARVLINLAVFLQNVISQHVGIIFTCARPKYVPSPMHLHVYDILFHMRTNSSYYHISTKTGISELVQTYFMNRSSGLTLHPWKALEYAI